MISATVLTPTVNVLGTLMRMFCNDSAFSSGMLIVILDQRPHERTATVHGFAGAPSFHASIDDKYLVRWTAFVTACHEYDGEEGKHNKGYQSQYTETHSVHSILLL